MGNVNDEKRGSTEARGKFRIKCGTSVAAWHRNARGCVKNKGKKRKKKKERKTATVPGISGGVRGNVRRGGKHREIECKNVSTRKSHFISKNRREERNTAGNGETLVLL